MSSRLAKRNALFCPTTDKEIFESLYREKPNRFVVNFAIHFSHQLYESIVNQLIKIPSLSPPIKRKLAFSAILLFVLQ